MLQIQFNHKVQISNNTWEFCFSKPNDYDFISGQYADFGYPQNSHDPDTQRLRTMTIISHPNENKLCFTTRITKEMSLFKQHLLTLKAGDDFYVNEPRGDVVLPKLTSVPLVFIAGGIGIASFISMLKDMLLTNQTRNITMFYAYHSPLDRTYGELLDLFPFENLYEYISPSRLQLSDILTSDSIKNSQFYVSGTESFTMSFVNGLRQTGISDTQIIFDYFTGY